MSKNFDVIIIGGGNAGFGAAAQAQEAGMTVAFIEERDFGGTCSNRGCTPKKVLVAAAHTLHEIEQADTHGIHVSAPVLDWTKLIQREKAMISFIPDAMAKAAEKRGTVIKGSATFTGPNSIEVAGEELTAEHIVIATGSKTRPLPIPGAEHLITSEDVLSEEEQPEDVVFIGGGVIAMEFSHVYARAGTKVTILEVMPRLLPRLEADAVAVLQSESKRIGIDIKTGVAVQKISQENDKTRVQFEHDGEIHHIDADRVVNGAGRVANVEGLNLDAANIEHDRLAIKTDGYLRSTSNPKVWVCGDALVSSPQLSPVATWEGKIVGNNIVNGLVEKPDYSIVPSAVYTVPALASVGLTEAAALEEGLNFRSAVNDMTGWFSGKTYSETVAWAKILIDQNTDQIIGAHMVGHNSEELIHLFAMAMRYGISVGDIKQDLFAFPTFSADIKNLL